MYIPALEKMRPAPPGEGPVCVCVCVCVYRLWKRCGRPHPACSFVLRSAAIKAAYQHISNILATRGHQGGLSKFSKVSAVYLLTV